METWLVIALVLVLLALLVILLIIKNRKDEKEFEEQLKQDYRKPKSGEVDTEGTDSI
jgi:hypothetical protein